MLTEYVVGQINKHDQRIDRIGSEPCTICISDARSNRSTDSFTHFKSNSNTESKPVSPTIQFSVSGADQESEFFADDRPDLWTKQGAFATAIQSADHIANTAADPNTHDRPNTLSFPSTKFWSLSGADGTSLGGARLSSDSRAICNTGTNCAPTNASSYLRPYAFSIPLSNPSPIAIADCGTVTISIIFANYTPISGADCFTFIYTISYSYFCALRDSFTCSHGCSVSPSHHGHPDSNSQLSAFFFAADIISDVVAIEITKPQSDRFAVFDAISSTFRRTECDAVACPVT